MTSKTVLIAKVSPIRQNEQKFIEIKVKNLGKISDNLCEMKSNENIDERPEKMKRKRERLDHLSHEDKIKRRKLHNRAAAQLARDRKKLKMNELQKNIDLLIKQKSLLKSSYDVSINRCKELEKENIELKQRLSSMEGLSKTAETRITESCPQLEDAINLLVGDNESDAVLEFLHSCSQQLLDANVDNSSTDESTDATIDECIDETNHFSQLESIQDLIQFPVNIESRSALPSQELSENRFDFKALSPLSCQSDSGYESANSPQIAFNNGIDDQNEDILWKQTLSELFPDLI